MSIKTGIIKNHEGNIVKNFITKIRLLLVLAYNRITSEPKVLQFAVTTHSCKIKKGNPTDQKLEQAYRYLRKNCDSYVKHHYPYFKTLISYEPRYDSDTQRATGVLKFANIIPEA